MKGSVVVKCFLLLSILQIMFGLRASSCPNPTRYEIKIDDTDVNKINLVDKQDNSIVLSFIKTHKTYGKTESEEFTVPELVVYKYQYNKEDGIDKYEIQPDLAKKFNALDPNTKNSYRCFLEHLPKFVQDMEKKGWQKKEEPAVEPEKKEGGTALGTYSGTLPKPTGLLEKMMPVMVGYTKVGQQESVTDSASGIAVEYLYDDQGEVLNGSFAIIPQGGNKYLLDIRAYNVDKIKDPSSLIAWINYYDDIRKDFTFDAVEFLKKNFPNVNLRDVHKMSISVEAPACKFEDYAWGDQIEDVALKQSLGAKDEYEVQMMRVWPFYIKEKGEWRQVG